MSTVFVTGGAGFIGSAVIRLLLAETDHVVVNIDKLTYAANPAALKSVEHLPRYQFEQADIGDSARITALFNKYQPDAVMHLAAETHVDRSIDGPGAFIQTNLVGTFVLLEAARQYYAGLAHDAKARFRFHHISTDEVFGSLPPNGAFTETTPYAPNSPYSASKAGSDHLVRAWHATYGLPVLLSNCSNNYGPWQFPEKLIPLMIGKALRYEPLPVYGKGDQVRDWLHVEDHARALVLILKTGKIGESYNVGGNAERQNIEVVHLICDLLDEWVPGSDTQKRRALIRHVTDRPGHDQRYAMDTRKIAATLGWQPQFSFETGIAETVRWYLDHRDWWESISHYQGDRLGLAKAAS